MRRKSDGRASQIHGVHQRQTSFNKSWPLIGIGRSRRRNRRRETVRQWRFKTVPLKFIFSWFRIVLITVSMILVGSTVSVPPVFTRSEYLAANMSGWRWVARSVYFFEFVCVQINNFYLRYTFTIFVTLRRENKQTLNIQNKD